MERLGENQPCQRCNGPTHHGAYDLLPKPLDEDRVLPAIRRSVERRAFSATLHRLRSELNHSDGGFLGRPSASHASSEVNGAAPLAAPSLMDSPVRSLRELEREAIQRALVATGGSVGKAARLLGMGRATLYRRLASSDPRVALRPVEMAAK